MGFAGNERDYTKLMELIEDWLDECPIDHIRHYIYSNLEIEDLVDEYVTNLEIEKAEAFREDIKIGEV